MASRIIRFVRDLFDVSSTSPADNHVLAYDAATSKYINQTAAQAGLSAVGHTHTLSSITDAGTAAAKNADNSANNTVLLDGSGLLPTSVLPPLSITKPNVVSSQAAMLALTAEQGDIAIRSDIARSYILSTNSPGTLADWKELLSSGADNVSSVNSQTGNVVLTTTVIPEGTNQYYTLARVQAAAPNVTIATQGSNAGLSIAGQALSLAFATGANAGAMTAPYAGLLDGATDANTASAIVKRDASGIINVSWIKIDAGVSQGMSIGDVHAYQQASGIIRFGGSITVDGTFNGSGANLTSIPESAVNNLTTDLAAKAALAGATFTGSVKKGVGSIAYAATVTPNCDSYNTVNIGTLTGNVTIAAPTGTPVDGQELVIGFTQDGTGGRTHTWNAAFAFGTDILSTDVPTTASKSYYVGCKYHLGSTKWRVVSIVRGF